MVLAHPPCQPRRMRPTPHRAASRGGHSGLRRTRSRLESIHNIHTPARGRPSAYGSRLTAPNDVRCNDVRNLTIRSSPLCTSALGLEFEVWDLWFPASCAGVMPRLDIAQKYRQCPSPFLLSCTPSFLQPTPFLAELCTARRDAAAAVQPFQFLLKPLSGRVPRSEPTDAAMSFVPADPPLAGSHLFLCPAGLWPALVELVREFAQVMIGRSR